MGKAKQTQHASSSRIRKLLVRLNAWKVLCNRLGQREVQPYDLESKENTEANNVMTITEVVTQSFNNCLAPDNRIKLPPHRLVYLERVLKDLEETTRDQSGRLIDRMHNVLLQLNFNARQYCLAYIREVTERIRDKNTLEEKTDVLYLHMKTIAQLQCERGMKYYDQFPSVKEFIGSWLVEEIAYLERKAAKYDEPQPSGDYVGSSVPMKVYLDTSVARLACITRALVERGIIQNSNVSDLSQLLSRFVITRRSENVSARAFRLRYYDIEDATRNSVIQSLKELINHIKQFGQTT